MTKVILNDIKVTDKRNKGNSWKFKEPLVKYEALCKTGKNLSLSRDACFLSPHQFLPLNNRKLVLEFNSIPSCIVDRVAVDNFE